MSRRRHETSGGAGNLRAPPRRCAGDHGAELRRAHAVRNRSPAGDPLQHGARIFGRDVSRGRTVPPGRACICDRRRWVHARGCRGLDNDRALQAAQPGDPGGRQPGLRHDRFASDRHGRRRRPRGHGARGGIEHAWRAKDAATFEHYMQRTVVEDGPFFIVADVEQEDMASVGKSARCRSTLWNQASAFAARSRSAGSFLPSGPFDAARDLQPCRFAARRA